MTSLELKLLDTVLQVIEGVKQRQYCPEEVAKLSMCSKILTDILDDNSRG